MSYRIDPIFTLLILGIALVAFTNAQMPGGAGAVGGAGGGADGSSGGEGRDPEAVKDDNVTHGLIGSFLDKLGPITRMILEYINDLLVRYKGLQLPCTLYDPMKWDWECTPHNDN